MQYRSCNALSMMFRPIRIKDNSQDTTFVNVKGISDVKRRNCFVFNDIVPRNIA